MARSDSALGAPPLVRFEGVSKRFGGVTALDNVTLDLHAGEFFTLLGPSGCGKTTLLRLLAGFERPDSGRILLNGEDITAMPPHRRPLNMMFQNYALFPHLSVAGNIAFGLKQDGTPKAEIERRVGEALALLRLDGLGGRKPDQLSGGQRQRVALARALVKRPRVLLLDEPLAALDKKLRDDTRHELVALQRSLFMTFMMVTHDQHEAMSVSTRIGVMNAGRLVQVGTPADLYERPVDRWVAEFVGDISVIEGTLRSDGTAGHVLETPAGLRVTLSNAGNAKPGATVAIALRPERIAVTPIGVAPPPNAITGVVSDISYFGASILYRVTLCNGTVVKASATNTATREKIAVDDKVWLSWPADAGAVLRP